MPMTDVTLSSQVDHPPARALRKSVSYVFAFSMLGMMMASLGPTLPSLERLTGTDTAQISILFVLRSLGSLVGTLAFGRVYDRLPGHPLMGLSLCVMGVLMIVAPQVPLLLWMGVVFCVIGLMEAILQVGGNTLMIWLHGRRVAPFTNALAFAYGAGSFLAPVIVAQVLLSSGDVRDAYLIMGLMMIPPAVLILLQPSPRSPIARTVGADGASHLPQIQWLLVLGIAAFLALMVGIEASLGGLLTSYAIVVGGMDEIDAAYLTSVFWASLTVSRLIAIGVAVWVRPPVILILNLTGSLASVALVMALPDSLAALWAGVIGLGVFTASIFPTMLAMSGRRMALPAQVTSIFFAGAAIGAMTLPWLIGQLFDSQPRAMMWLIAGALVAMCALLYALLRRLAPPAG